MNTVRLYGEFLNVWKSWNFEGTREIVRQYEVAYKEYDPATNELVETGSEDFSAERYKTIRHAWVWIWDGEKRNKGGYRWFECLGLYKFPRSQTAAFKQLIKTRHPEAVEIQLRS